MRILTDTYDIPYDKVVIRTIGTRVEGFLGDIIPENAIVLAEYSTQTLARMAVAEMHLRFRQGALTFDFHCLSEDVLTAKMGEEKTNEDLFR